ncbi:MAG: NAD(P)/FAD-dependent oxidoreductase [Mesorhizobium sp.]|uniref:NAD(P)-binding domain-containing protein n=1 Tax=Mesorhizobium sp. TaxID=1871066 RepID=UPI001ACB0C9C|nr:NAD(P)/FAD-dependent oxidoreductase [Mesorhizobium sp.]MBN9219710.1 NAD(P)/FAD-dependent oxidoreductase [Mesorhizobium sp.]
MTASTPGTDCEVAVIGAGPFGLAAASALKAAGIDTRTFGGAMSFWRDHMPRGMRLRSPWHATYIGHTNGPLSLDSYAKTLGISPDEPLHLENFVGYGLWIQAQAVPDLDTRWVGRVELANGGFRLALADGDAVTARRVVVAMGLMNQQLIPTVFQGISDELVSHASEHTDYGSFRGKRVAVIGRGQSACESAVLLKRGGADVELVCHGPVHWLGYRALSGKQSWSLRDFLSERLASPSRVGPFPISWLVEVPGFVHMFPEVARAGLNRRSLGAGATGWLRPDFDGIRIRAGGRIVGASARDNGIELRFEKDAATFDHVLLGTGYRIDIAKLGLFAPDTLGAIARREGMPMLSAGFESSIPGLHFIGASAVGSFGPLMRFTAGTPFAARTVARFVRKAAGKGYAAA